MKNIKVIRTSNPLFLLLLLPILAIVFFMIGFFLIGSRLFGRKKQVARVGSPDVIEADFRTISSLETQESNVTNQ
jgi:hypothetical protein